MKKQTITYFILLLILISCKKQENTTPLQVHKIKQIISTTGTDTGSVITFYYSNTGFLDSATEKNNSFFNPFTIYYHLFKSSDSVIVYSRIDETGDFTRKEAFVLTGNLVSSYIRFGDPFSFSSGQFSYYRNSSQKVDSVICNNIDLISFKNLLYNNDSIVMYKTYSNLGTGQISESGKVYITYEANKIRKDGMSVPFYDPYGSVFQRTSLGNFGAGFNNAIKRIQLYDLANNLISETNYNFLEYSDSIVRTNEINTMMGSSTEVSVTYKYN